MRSFGVSSSDPFGLGYVAGVTVLAQAAVQTWQTANDTRYVRVISAGTISKIGFQVETASGNISVAVYRRTTDSGRLAKPGERLATSGVVACPAAGYNEVSLDTSVTVQMGDYLALSCDNTTASFFCTAGGFSRDIFRPWTYVQASAHPAPATAASLVGQGSKMPTLVGVA